MTVASTSLKTDTLYSEMMDVVCLSEGRGDASQREEETCLKHGSGLHLLYLDPCSLIWMCLYCASIMCIVCHCTLITLANC